jgi:uncharacterized membrane protein
LSGVDSNQTLLYVGGLCIGIVAGLRSLTALAVVCWALRLGWLDISGSRLAFLGSTLACVVVSLLALVELVTDKLPNTPNRTAAMPVGARIFTGVLSAIIIFTSAHQSVALGAILGAVGAVVGTYGGYNVRHFLVKDRGLPDLVVALAEDVVAVGGGFLLVSHLF